MSLVRLLTIGLVAAAPLLAAAADAPHENGGNLCQNCHLGHNAPSGSLTKGTGNFNLCGSCHIAGAPRFEFPWVVEDQAGVAAAGRSHSWSGIATGHGATAPSPSSADVNEAEMGKRLDGGKLMCSTCHDQHQADALPLGARGARQVSAVKKTGTGTGTMAVDAVVASAPAKGYLVEIVDAGTASAATYRVSYDNGKSWFGCAAGTHDYRAYVPPPSSNACTLGSAIALDANATVSFAADPATYAAGGTFTFYVSYPFLRADVTDAKMCNICHRDRNMSVANVNGTSTPEHPVVLGTTKFHHPVGAGLVPDRMLEPDGDAASDGISRNDLVLGAGGGVTCLTCHRVHNAYSNSLVTDP